MKKNLTTLFFFLLLLHTAQSQTPLTTAPNFSVKTVDGTVIELYPLLDQGKIVVLDFFSVSCGPCQLYAPHFQGAFEAFGRNLGNVFFLGINYNGTNNDVIFFDSVYNLSFPSASGLDGGGNGVFHLFQLSAYPTVIVIKPDKSIPNPYIWPPTTNNIIDAVLLAGGTLVGIESRRPDEGFSIAPNPLRDRAKLTFTLKSPENVSIDLVSASGQILARPVAQQKFGAGSHTINISAAGLPNGIVFAVFTTESNKFIKKLQVVNN